MAEEIEEQPRPRGRAAAEIRTGRFIRAYLEQVGEASISDLHGALITEIGRRNQLRPKARRLQAPTYESFYKYFWRLRQWGLVEWVRDEPTVDVPHDRLLSIRMVGPWPKPPAVGLPETEVVPSTRRIYRLSALGKTPEMAVLWDDPLARRLMRITLGV